MPRLLVGANHCQCAQCEEFFNSVSAFDAHQRLSKGGKVEWAAEGRAPGVLLRAGWTRNSLKAGETITVDMSPAKDGTRSAIIARVTKADGTILSNQPNFQ